MDTSANVRLLLPERAWRHVAPILILIWGIAQWFLMRPANLAIDWNNWRQADTQSMALRFLEPGSSIWYPKVNWGGDGPGFVESEFPLYAYLASGAFRIFGASEEVSQFLSLACVCAAAWVLFALLEREFGGAAGLAGMCTFLCSRALVFIATAIQPESLSVLLSVIALYAAIQWRDHPERGWMLGLHGLAGLLACLTKPTAMQIMVASLMIFAARPAARKRRGWIAITYGLVAAAGVAYLLHAKSIYLEHGNTFGLLSGGDRKTPLPEHLVHAWLYWMALKLFLKWGPGWGILGAVIVATWRRRWPWAAWSLLVGAGLWSLASLRYSHMDFGSHYMVLGSVFGAWLIAAQVAPPQATRSAKVATAFCLAAMAASGAVNYSDRYQVAHRPEPDEPLIEVGRALEALVRPGQRVIIQSSQGSWDDWWKSATNFEDPTLLYLSSTRGWVLPADEQGGSRVEQWRHRGARWFVSAQGDAMDPELRRWLREQSRLVQTARAHEIWSLPVPP